MATFIVNNNSHKIIYYKQFLTKFCGNSDLFEFNRFQRFAVCQFENLEIIISCKNDYKILCSYYTKGIFQKYCLQKQRKKFMELLLCKRKKIFVFCPKIVRPHYETAYPREKKREVLKSILWFSKVPKGLTKIKHWKIIYQRLKKIYTFSVCVFLKTKKEIPYYNPTNLSIYQQKNTVVVNKVHCLAE